MSNGAFVFDFRLPRHAYGHSSGWHPKRAFSLNRQPDLAPRMPVALQPIGESVPFRLEDGFLNPCTSDAFPATFMVKTSPHHSAPGAIFGLSSGGGSAIFEKGDSVYRLKRCGQAYDGFTNEPFFTHAVISSEASDMIEVTYKPLGGLMTVVTALLELRMAHTFHCAGLSSAIEPVGMLIVTGLPSVSADANVAAALYRIKSDVRLDEMVYMALSPVLAELFEAGAISYNPVTGWWDAAGTPLEGALHMWSDSFDRVTRLGIAAGGCYRNVHEAGYLRGKGSSWFGNEVVDADGRLSVVDFDGGNGVASEYPRKIADMLRVFESNCYCTESFGYLLYMRPSTLGVFGSAFIEGFRLGYKEASESAIPVCDVKAIIAAHLGVLPSIRRSFHFDIRTEEAHLPTGAEAS
jgi:hypothetical protein